MGSRHQPPRSDRRLPLPRGVGARPRPQDHRGLCGRSGAARRLARGRGDRGPGKAPAGARDRLCPGTRGRWPLGAKPDQSSGGDAPVDPLPARHRRARRGSDGGALDAKREFEVFNGSIVPGNHTISVHMVFRGHGYGIFSYLKGYTFKVRSSHTFTAAEGRQNAITVKAFEKGNITTELKDRPAVKFKVNLYSVGASKGGKKAASDGKGGSK